MYTPAAVFGSTWVGRPFAQPGHGRRPSSRHAAGSPGDASWRRVADAPVADAISEPAPSSTPTMPMAAIRLHLMFILREISPVTFTGTHQYRPEHHENVKPAVRVAAQLAALRPLA